jgi:pentatricopeptide repeat protein
VSIYGKCGLFKGTERVLDQIQDRRVVSWNVLMSEFVEHGFVREALECLDRMELDHTAFNTITYVCRLKTCSGVRVLHKGRIRREYLLMQCSWFKKQKTRLMQ